LTRVIFVSHEGSEDFIGGHVTQRDETVSALLRAGVDARVGSPEEALSGGFDVVHVLGDVGRLLRLGRPDGRLVVTPIYFSRRIMLGPIVQRPGYAHLLAKRARRRAAWLRHPRACYARYRVFEAQLAALSSVDLIVVNSNAEAAKLRRDARRLPPLRVAYSGVAAEMFGGDPEQGRAILGVGEEPFVLSVARVDHNKNTLGVALAMRGLPQRLVLVGAVRPNYRRYFAAVQQVAPALVQLGHLDHDSLRHAYAAAAVHVLASRYETTGLATLEALAAGTAVVVGNGAPQHEYFDGCAAFCRPPSVRSIRRAIQHALEGPTGSEIARARHFSWDRTAAQLIEAYGA
jgi:glycosyltransferase involved in cell wall biosynthesis